MSGKGLVIFGGILGIFSMLSFYISPSLGAWWQVTFEFYSWKSNYYINAFGIDDRERSALGNLALAGGILFLIGSLAAIVAAGVKESKGMAFLGSIIMLIGIVLFLYALYTFEDFNRLMGVLSFFSGDEYNPFFGRYDTGNVSITWSLGLGFFIGAIAAIMVIIGSMAMD